MQINTKNLLSSGAFALVVLGLVVASSGGALAATAEIANGTVTVDSETNSVYSEINTTDNTAATNVTVTYYGIADGNETQVATNTVEVAAGTTQLEEYKSVNSSNYSEYRVVVEADDTTNTTATVGTLQQVSGGSGGWIDGASNTQVGAGLAVVAGLVLFGRKD